MHSSLPRLVNSHAQVSPRRALGTILLLLFFHGPWQERESPLFSVHPIVGPPAPAFAICVLSPVAMISLARSGSGVPETIWRLVQREVLSKPRSLVRDLSLLLSALSVKWWVGLFLLGEVTVDDSRAILRAILRRF